MNRDLEINFSKIDGNFFLLSPLCRKKKSHICKLNGFGVKQKDEACVHVNHFNGKFGTVENSELFTF